MLKNRVGLAVATFCTLTLASPLAASAGQDPIDAKISQSAVNQSASDLKSLAQRKAARGEASKATNSSPSSAGTNVASAAGTPSAPPSGAVVTRVRDREKKKQRENHRTPIKHPTPGRH